MTQSKAALRARYKTLRAAIDPSDRAEAGRAAAEVVLAYRPFETARSVALFASFRDEIPTDSLVEALRLSGRQVLLPRVAAAGSDMSLCTFTALADLGVDRFGIRTPNGEVFTGPVDLVFVPGLAFGLDGSRLGYGGGFYDRLLARAELASALRCGLGYDLQVVAKLPMEVHDVRLTHVATPAGVMPVPV